MALQIALSHVKHAVEPGRTTAPVVTAALISLTGSTLTTTNTDTLAFRTNPFAIQAALLAMVLQLSPAPHATMDQHS